MKGVKRGKLFIRHETLEPDLERRPDFEPRLPRSIRVKGSGILGKLKRELHSQRSGLRGKKGRRTPGARGKSRGPRVFTQRVIVKARVVKGTGKKSVARLRAHLRYLNRSGTGLGVERPEFFNKDSVLERGELSKRAAEWANDPHHFRFIISPEKGNELELKEYVKHVVQTIEDDVKTKLEWYGTCHYNTDNPHAHIVIRGVDENGKPLLLSRDYLSHGIRHVAEQEATVRLGSKNVGEFQRGIEKSLTELRFTFIDRELKRQQDDSIEQVFRLSPLRGDSREWEKIGRNQKITRLSFLQSKGLAREIDVGTWKLHGDLENTLKELHFRSQILKKISPLLEGLEAGKQELVIHRESAPLPAKFRGIVLAKDLSDEMTEKSFLLLSGDDGRTHYLPLGKFSEPAGFGCKPGQIVLVEPAKTRSQKAEEVMIKFQAGQGGVFDIKAFERWVEEGVENGTWRLSENITLSEYLEFFQTRCQSLTRDGYISDLGGGRWEFPKDLAEKVEAASDINQKKLKTRVTTESFTSLQEQIESPIATWLDKRGSRELRMNTAGSEYEREVIRAAQARKKFLERSGIEVSNRSFSSLIGSDEKALREKLTKAYGPELRIPAGGEVRGKVVGYELLADGHRMIVKTAGGYVLRKVSPREGQLAFQTELLLSKELQNLNGKKKYVLRSSLASSGNTGQTKKRGKK